MSLETDKQYKRLCEMYAEKSDDELLDMNERRDDLTELAQQALAQVMKDRRLEAEADVSHAVEADNRQESEDAGLARGEVVVCSFDDAFRANDAIRVVTAAGISCRMMDLNVLTPRKTMDGSYLINLGMVVDEKDKPRALKVLEKELGFPPPEEDDDAPVSEVLADLVMLSMFARRDALLAAQALGEAGISYVWRDGKQERVDLPDEDTVAIEVGAESAEDAMRVVEQKIGRLPGSLA